MILLITSAAKAQECAAALQQATTEITQVASTLRQAVTQLRMREYSAVVIDQSVLDAEPEQSETILQHIGMAIPVHVNFVISGIERIVRELHAAMHRHKQALLIARESAQQALRNELKGTVTALLLSCEMALLVPNLPPPAEVKLRVVHELAHEMRAKLGVAA